MATGSIIGTILGGLLLGAVPEAVLIPLLVALLLASCDQGLAPQLTIKLLYPHVVRCPPRGASSTREPN